MSSPLRELGRLGQSLWYDNIHRGLLRSGELARMVREDGIVGVTSNPTIFDKAIGEGGEYDEQILALAAQGYGVEESYEALVTEDIRQAADVLRPVYEATAGRDGYVSLEVSPELAYDAEATVEAVRRLWRLLDRPNVMVKIPGTRQGLPAIQRCLMEGMNINVTLLFSVRRYEEVVEAYIRALEERARQGQPLDGIASVASFFVSRVDTLVDRLLEERALEAGPAAEEAASLLGRAAVANAKLAYERFQALYAGERFRALAARGARPQRLLWASTSTKDPRYSDVKYVEELIGPDTVNTVPQVTLDAFRDHGRVAPTLTAGLEEAKEIIARLARLGIDMEAVAQELERQGVELFAESYRRTLASLAEKRARLLAAT